MLSVPSMTKETFVVRLESQGYHGSVFHKRKTTALQNEDQRKDLVRLFFFFPDPSNFFRRTRNPPNATRVLKENEKAPKSMCVLPLRENSFEQRGKKS
jgi:hypothetical protein